MQNQHETLGDIIKSARIKADISVEAIPSVYKYDPGNLPPTFGFYHFESE